MPRNVCKVCACVGMRSISEVHPISFPDLSYRECQACKHLSRPRVEYRACQAHAMDLGYRDSWMRQASFAWCGAGDMTENVMVPVVYL